MTPVRVIAVIAAISFLVASYFVSTTTLLRAGVCDDFSRHNPDARCTQWIPWMGAAGVALFTTVACVATELARFATRRRAKRSPPP